MRVLKWLLSISLQKRISNEEIRKRNGTVKISDKIKVARTYGM